MSDAPCALRAEQHFSLFSSESPFRTPHFFTAESTEVAEN
jgi:hypothetical protein